MPNDWPTFMQKDPVAKLFYGRLPEVFPEHQLVGLGPGGDVVGKVNSVPFEWAGSDEDLPPRGWDAILELAFEGREQGVRPTAVSLIEARIVPEHRGAGLSAELLAAARENARSLGFSDLFGPVRPPGKAQEPHTTMADYVSRTRADGLPHDDWLRVHVRMGARVVSVCPLSMVIPGTLAQWREWTGLPLRETAATEVPGALVPVWVSLEHDHAVYVEPGVWVHHRLVA